jgi:hypothetical protein
MTKEIRDPADLKSFTVSALGRVAVGPGGILRFSILIEQLYDDEWKNTVKWLNVPKIRPSRTTRRSQVWSSHSSALHSSLTHIRNWIEWITAERTGITFEISIETQTVDRRSSTKQLKAKK